MADNVDTPAANKLLEYFCDKQHPTQDLLQELRKIAGPDRPGILSTVREGLKGLSAEQRKIADENMQLLRGRVEANTQEKAADPKEVIPEQEVTQLRGELDALQTEVVPPPEVKKPETLFDPTSWTPEHQQQAKDIAIVGAVVVGGAILLHTLSGKAKSFFGKVKMAVGLGVAGVLGYLGLKAYRQIDKMQDLQDKYDKALAKMKEGGDAARRELEEARRLLEAARNEKKLPEVSDVVEEVEESFSVEMAKQALPLQYDVAHSLDPKGHSPKPYLTDANEILTLAAGSRAVRMQQFFDCMDAEDTGDVQHMKLLKEIYGNTTETWTKEESAQKILSLKFVLGFLKKNRSILERSGKLRGEDPGKLSLGEALNVFAGAPGAIGDLSLQLASTTAASLMKLEVPNPMPAIEEFFKNDDLYSDRMVELVLQPLLKESAPAASDPVGRERVRTQCMQVAAHFLKSGDITVKNIESSFPPSWTEGGGERTIARAVASKIQSPETAKRLLQASLIAENTTDPTEMEIRTVIQEYLASGKVTLRDAFQLHYLLETGGASNALLFFKTSKLLDNSGRHDLAVNRYHAVADRLYDAVSKGPEAIAALLKELNLTPEQEREMMNVAYFAAEHVTVAGQRMWDHVKELTDRHPLVAAALGIGVGGPLVYTGYRLTIKPAYWVYAKIQWSLIEKLADSDSVKIIEIAKKTGKSIEEVSLAVDDAKLAVTRLHNADVGFHGPGYRRSARKLGMRARRDAYRKSPLAADTTSPQLDDASDTPKAPDASSPTAPKDPGTPEPPKGADKVDDAADAARTASSADDLVDGAKAADVLSSVDEARWSKVLMKFSEGANVGDVQAFLKLAAEEKLINLDAELISLINESPRAQKIIAGAIKTTEVKEVTRALSAAKLARNLRIGLNGLGAAGDVFGIYMAYADYQANGERIENAMNTNNEALAELYRNANYVYAAEGAQSVAGLTIGGVAIVKAAVGGESLLTALGTSGGLIMLPVAAAALGGGYMYRKAEGVSETWLRTSKDWERASSPGELLEKLKELGPGQRGEFQGWGKGTVAEQLVRMKLASTTGNWSAYAKWEEEGEQRIESANESTRGEITKAYVVRTSLLPKEAKETDQQYQERFDLYVMDQMEYIGRISGGTFAYMMGENYENARIYAELQAKSRSLQAQGGSEVMQWKNDRGEVQKYDLKDFEDFSWKEERGTDNKQAILARYINDRKEQKLLQFTLMERLPTGYSADQKKQVITQDIILACQDDLLRLDGRIAGADFSGVLGKEDSGEGVARYTAMMLFKEGVAEQAGKLLTAASSKEGVTKEAYDKAIITLRAILGNTDVLEYQKIGIQRRYVTEGYVVDPAATKDVLSAQHMLNIFGKNDEPTDYLRKSILKLSDNKLDGMRKELGELLLIQKGATEKSGYYQIQRGYVFNKYLYSRFSRGNWQVSLGNSDGPWSDPEGYRVSGLRNSVALADPEVDGQYNEIIRGLADANKGFRKEEVERKAA